MKQNRTIAVVALLVLSLVLSGCQAASLPAQETDDTSETTTVAPTTSTTESTPAPLAMGTPREKTFALLVDWSKEQGLTGDITIKVYVDGELDTSKTTVLDASVGSKSFTFKGRGKKDIRVKIDNKIIYNYIVDFDSGTLEMYDE